MVKVIKIDDVEYVRKDEVEQWDMDGEYVIIRSRDAGVFAGIVGEQAGDMVTMKSCRRIWYWKGANNLSQMSLKGLDYPKECKISEHTTNHQIFGVCEIIPCTKEARKSIEGVESWKK